MGAFTPPSLESREKTEFVPPSLGSREKPDVTLSTAPRRFAEGTGLPSLYRGLMKDLDKAPDKEVQGVKNLWETLKNVAIGGTSSHMTAAKEAAQKGDYTGAVNQVLRGITSLTPNGQAADLADNIHQDLKNGNIAGALGTGAMLAAPVVGGKTLGAVRNINSNLPQGALRMTTGQAARAVVGKELAKLPGASVVTEGAGFLKKLSANADKLRESADALKATEAAKARYGGDEFMANTMAKAPSSRPPTPTRSTQAVEAPEVDAYQNTLRNGKAQPAPTRSTPSTPLPEAEVSEPTIQEIQTKMAREGGKAPTPSRATPSTAVPEAPEDFEAATRAKGKPVSLGSRTTPSVPEEAVAGEGLGEVPPTPAELKGALNKAVNTDTKAQRLAQYLFGEGKGIQPEHIEGLRNPKKAPTTPEELLHEDLRRSVKGEIEKKSGESYDTSWDKGLEYLQKLHDRQN